MHKTKFLVKRSRHERRVKDLGPPEEGERGVTPERRHPVVEFVEFDDHIEIGKVVEGIGPKD